MEAFAQYESGVSLATLQTIFADVAVELNQMVEAERLLRGSKQAMSPSPELGRKVVAALAQKKRQYQASVFMSGFWRLAAPVGIAALSFMFVLAGQQGANSNFGDSDLLVTEEAVPMMAAKMSVPAPEETAISLMAIAPEGDERVMEDGATDDSFAQTAYDTGVDGAADTHSDSVYLWQMISLGLLVLLSIVLLYKHIQVRRRAA